MDISHDYVVDVEWDSTRKGSLSAVGLRDTLEVATPPEFPDGISGIWSPEHLFVAAVNSCLMTTFLAIAANSKLEFISFTSKGTGKLAMENGKYRMTEVILEPILTIPDSNQSDRAKRILEKSEAACLISNSINSTITFLPQVLVQEKSIA